MVAGRPDWYISRQRYGGVPLAVFTDREKQELHPDTSALLRRIADKVEAEGLEAWFGSTPADWGVDDAQFEKGTDTLDVWFDSGVAHQCVFKLMIPEALDRSEEHTSELPVTNAHLVCRLLLEKKKQYKSRHHIL